MAGALSSLKPVSSIEAFERGEYHRVPLMIGATEDDGLGKGELELVMPQTAPAEVPEGPQLDLPLVPPCVESKTDTTDRLPRLGFPTPPQVMFDGTDVTDLRALTALFSRCFGERCGEALSYYYRSHAIPGGSVTTEEEEEAEAAAVNSALGLFGADMWYGGTHSYVSVLVLSSLSTR